MAVGKLITMGYTIFKSITMKPKRVFRLTLGFLLCICVQAFCKSEIVEHLPNEAYVENWEPFYVKRIVSYVQLPGDSLEYRKIKMYVKYRAKVGIGKNEQVLKLEELTRLRYLGAYLVPTGRRFDAILDDSVFGIENTKLTTQDQLMNNEIISQSQPVNP